MRRRTIGMALAWALVAGCAVRAPVASPLPARGETRAELLARARVDLGCERASLVELAPRHVAAAGCGAQREYRSVCEGTRACEWIAIDDLAIRASFELECPVADLEVVTLGASSRGVVGCGVRATYVLVCQGEGCHWLPSTVHRSAAERHFAPASLVQQ
ncbi:hypothetical protein [Sandaracinus amylolyticus]|uniref:hypothetical protein n=1 Tax=Sandaracinus amylolyticus TaxID=927083 RepID=UPI001F29EC90|nr:hypothetical protein [Sandaracinus amylolyticus]UJR86517.1 Hypothetical protein I5071_86120 [Sandaracinus amylolyticus]